MNDQSRHYTILLDRQPQKVLRRLPRDLLARIDRTILALADDPRPPGCRKLGGYQNLYRVRVGDWRISYAVEDDRLIVVVIEVAPRGAAYQW
jgi:mRNA interferase RelE/StbE